jgi:hypothetical protein
VDSVVVVLIIPREGWVIRPRLQESGGERWSSGHQRDVNEGHGAGPHSVQWKGARDSGGGVLLPTRRLRRNRWPVFLVCCDMRFTKVISLLIVGLLLSHCDGTAF